MSVTNGHNYICKYNTFAKAIVLNTPTKGRVFRRRVFSNYTTLEFKRFCEHLSIAFVLNELRFSQSEPR